MTLLHGNCLELMKKIPDESIDMILCDLPYQITQCKWDKIIPFDLLWKEYDRVIKKNGAIVLFSMQPFTTKLIQSNLKDFRYCWYWKKNYTTGFSYARYQPMRQIEDICVFYKKSPTYNPQGLEKIENPKTYTKKNSSDLYTMRGKKEYTPKYKNYPKNILEFSGVTNKDRFHPTQKPVELLEYLIKTYTHKGETILDNCIGSGSTYIACLNTDRKCIGIELDKTYFNLAEKRIYKHIKERGNLL